MKMDSQYYYVKHRDAIRRYQINGDSAWPLAPVWPGVRNPTFVYAWELPGVAGNVCNGLTPTVALQLATIVCGRWSTSVEGLVQKKIKKIRLGFDAIFMTVFESEVFEGILRFDGRKLEEVSRHHQLQSTEVAWKAISLVTELQKNQRGTGPCNSIGKDHGHWALEKITVGSRKGRRKPSQAVYQINGDSAWPLAPIWPGVRNPTFVS
eukprot:Gb_15170 [translate_table: standard]